MINLLPYYIIERLLITIVTELIFSFIFRVKNLKDYLNILLVNMLTNPIVVIISFLVNLQFGIIPRHIVLLILEILTIITEGIIYHKYLKYRKINPFLLSFILNCGSYFMGFLF